MRAWELKPTVKQEFRILRNEFLKRVGSDTAYNYLAEYKRFFTGTTKREGLLSLGLVDENPFEKLKLGNLKSRVSSKTQKQKAYKLQEIEAILQELKILEKSSFVYHSIYLDLATGLRIRDLCNIKIKNMDLDNQCLYTTIKGHGASLEKVIIHGKDAAEAIKEYIARHRITPRENDEEYLFINMRGNKATKHNISHVFNHIKKKLGIVNTEYRKLTIHSVRKTFATFLRRLGYPIDYIKERLAHLNISTTAIYLNEDEVTQKEIDSDLNPNNQSPVMLMRKRKKKYKQKEITEIYERMRFLQLKLRELSHQSLSCPNYPEEHGTNPIRLLMICEFSTWYNQDNPKWNETIDSQVLPVVREICELMIQLTPSRIQKLLWEQYQVRKRDFEITKELEQLDVDASMPELEHVSGELTNQFAVHVMKHAPIKGSTLLQVLEENPTLEPKQTKQALAIQLRLSGLGYKKIAKIMTKQHGIPISHNGVQYIVKKKYGCSQNIKCLSCKEQGRARCMNRALK
ncbi:MAG: tyrosine-type recombinase/integrase [Candidatus Helarchaeota archaeon]